MYKYAAIGIILIALFSAAGFAGYQYSEAEHAKKVAELNKTVYELGVVVQTETNVAAETGRQLKLANKGRINAIKINSHAGNKIRILQSNLDETVKELEVLRNDYNYIVLDVGAVVGVYNQARRECYGLPDASNTPVIPTKLSEFTGDSITGVVRYLAGQYCEVATDYNNLYLDAEKLLAQ